MKKIGTYLRNLPTGVKWIVGINIFIYIMTIFVFSVFGVKLQDYLGAYPTYSDNFSLLTILTSMFTHSMNFTHIFFNMLLMLVFAPFVERKLGYKKFIFYYFLIGVMGYTFINYSYHNNKINIIKSIENVGLNIDDVIIIDGEVSNVYLQSLNINQLESVTNYNYVISKTYGSSSSLFGIIVLYIMFNMLNIRKVLYNVLAIYFIVNATFEVFSYQHILNSSHYAHLGGSVCGFVLFILYKTKKGIN